MKPIVNFILFQFLIFSTICCQNPGKSADKFVKTDTLFSDEFCWIFSLESNEDIFILKKENSLYQIISNNQKKIGKLETLSPIYNFSIQGNCIAFSQILEDLPPKTILYSLMDFKKIKTIENFGFYSFIDNSNLVYFKQDIDSIYFYINNLKSSNFEFLFKGLNINGVYCDGSLYFYEMLDPKRTEYTNLTKINIGTNEKKSIKIPCYEKYLYFSTDTFLAISNNKLYLNTFDNKIIAFWDIPEVYSKILISDKKVHFYFWNSYDEELYGSTKYYLLRQTIDLGSYINNNQSFKPIVLDKD